MARFTWLHFTDLHVGQAGHHRWPRKRAEALEDLRHVHAQLGRVDAVLFTGDLVYSGKAEEFGQFSSEMDRVFAVLRELGSDPVLVAVPGNHDLARPPAGSAAVAALQHFPERPDIQDQLWTNPDSDYRKAVADAFAGWTTWSASGLSWGRLEGVKRDGLLPGDFLATWAGDGLRVGLVGLNSAALQLGGGEYEGRLALHGRQVTSLEPEFDDWARGHDACVLLTHHPESWLDETGRAELRGEIYTPDRFVLHLCGHNHQQRLTVLSEGSADPRRVILGRSLCGIERYGDGREERLFGYSAGQIEVRSQTRILRVWPRAATPKGDGSAPFGPDPFTVIVRGAEHTKPLDLGPSPRPVPPPSWATLDDALRRDIAEFLAREFRRPAARRGLLITAGVPGDPSSEWAVLLEPLLAHQLRELLVATGDPEGAQPLIDRLRAQPPADSGPIEGLLADRFADAARWFSDERFAEAAAAYASIAERASQLPDGRASRARALVNRAAALSGAGDTVAFTTLLRSGDIAVDALEPRGRINLARMRLSLGDTEGALAAVHGVDETGARVIHQLVALDRGEVPAELVDDPDVLLRVAVIEANGRRSQRALELASRASEIEGLSERGRQTAAELMGRALYRYWAGESDEEVSAPGKALRRLEEVASGPRRPAEGSDRPLVDWSEVDDLVLACNELPLPPRDRAEVGETPVWVGEAEQALSQAGPDPLRALGRKWAHVGPLLLEAARRLQSLDERRDALDLARRAFALLPGHGQREVLAVALLASGDRAGAQPHLAVLASRDPRPARTWEILVRAALDGEDVHGALALVEGWGRAESESPAPSVWEVAVRLRRGEVREAQGAAARALRWEGLSFEVVRSLAAAAIAAPVDRVLAGHIARELERADLRRHPAAELLRHQLLLASGSRTDVPIDWRSLQDAGLVRWVSLDEVRDVMLAHHRRGAVADRLWSGGLLAFESWAELRGWPVGAMGTGVARGELSIPPPVPETEPAEWRGRRVHLGALGVEILVALDLHESFGAAVGGVVLLADARARFAEGSADPFVATLPVEQAATDAAWLAFEGRPVAEGGGAALMAEDVPAVGAWLGSLGLVPRSATSAWTPPTGTVIVDGGAIHVLHERGWAQLFLDACGREGVAVAIDRGSVEARVARRKEIAARSEAAAVAQAAWRWLTDLQKVGKLEVRPVPPGPPLPALISGVAEPVEVQRSFAARELVLADPELVLVSSELVELGVLGKGPTAAHERRYVGLAHRSVTLAEVARDLAGERRPEVVGRLATAGCANALAGADVRALYDLFGGLGGEEPRRRLLGTVSSLGRQDRLVHASLLAVHAALGPMDAILDVWSEEPVPADAEARTIAVLDALVAMTDHTRGRERMLELALGFLAGQTVQRVGWFFERVGAAHRLAAHLVGPRLWRVVAGWAGRDRRWVAVQLAVAQAIRQEAGPLEVGDLIYGAIVAAAPTPTVGVHLAGMAIAAILNGRPFPRVLDQLTTLGRTVRAWQTDALAHLGAAELDGTDVIVQVGPTRVALALEGAVPEILPRAAEVADRLWFDDGIVAAAFSAWGDHPDEAALTAVRAALDHSPLRAVRADPRVILAWSRWADTSVLGPRTIADLRRLLSEPDDLTPEVGIIAAVDARMDVGGAWHGRDLPIARQLARIPGGLLGLARPEVTEEMVRAHVRLPEEHGRYPTGELVAALLSLGVAGKDRPVHRIDDLDVRLPELVARGAAAALRPTTPQDYAHHEAGLLRVCGSVVDALITEPLSERDRVWLGWRLFAWITAQILEGDDPVGAARALSSAAGGAAPAAADPYDPRRAGIDLRELTVLQALFLLRTAGAVDWHLLQPTLLRVASREWTADERELRERWTDASLGGLPLLAPDLARLLVLNVDLDVISVLEPLQRMAWLDDALRQRSGDHPLAIVSRAVLLAFAVRPQWSEAEAARIRDAVSGPGLPSEDIEGAGLLVAASWMWPDGHDVSEAVWSAIQRRLGTELGPLLVQEWFLASARAGRLGAAVDRVRRELATRTMDDRAYLAGLHRPFLHSDPEVRERARAVIDQLSVEPELAELIALLRGDSSDTSAQ